MRVDGGNHQQAAGVASTRREERLVRVTTAVLMTRTKAVSPNLEIATSAIEQLGKSALDAASEELLYAFYRGDCPRRRLSAAHALLSMIEASDAAGDQSTAARIREHLSKSTLPEDRELRVRSAGVMFSKSKLGVSRPGIGGNDPVETEAEAIELGVEAIEEEWPDSYLDFKPYRAFLEKGAWRVVGTSPRGVRGGVPYAEVRASDGAVIRTALTQ